MFRFIEHHRSLFNWIMFSLSTSTFFVATPMKVVLDIAETPIFMDLGTAAIPMTNIAIAVFGGGFAVAAFRGIIEIMQHLVDISQENMHSLHKNAAHRLTAASRDEQDWKQHKHRIKSTPLTEKDLVLSSLNEPLKEKKQRIYSPRYFASEAISLANIANNTLKEHEVSPKR